LSPAGPQGSPGWQPYPTSPVGRPAHRPHRRGGLGRFASDGHTFATGSDDGTVGLWDVGGLLAARDGAVQRACLVTDGGLNRDERYLPDLDYEDSCAAT
jgi:WD40 repeat protein